MTRLRRGGRWKKKGCEYAALKGGAQVRMLSAFEVGAMQKAVREAQRNEPVQPIRLEVPA